ncbi:MAG: hypothetical protein QOH90_292 [Actinomycetota bacterium]|nr:hypothetical protein [Actinomycetota bacterium]
MKRVSLLLIVAMVGMAALVPLLARTMHADVIDRNDTQGLLDVRKVHISPKDPPRYTVRTFARWTVPEMWDAGYEVVHFDSRGDGHFDYYAMVRSDGVELKGTLFRDRKRQEDYRVSNLKVWRPDKQRVTVRVPLGSIRVPKSRSYYRWYVDTLFVGDNCRSTCIDRVPNDGSVREVLRPSPTPSISPSPTITILPTP